MRIPGRFRLVPAWIANVLCPAEDRGVISLASLISYLLQKGMRERARTWIEDEKELPGGGLSVRLKGFPNPLEYPAGMNLTDLYSSIEMTYRPEHWHHYWSDGWRPSETDLVIDCGVAEGLFTLDVARTGCFVLGFEPLPAFQDVLEVNLKGLDKVEILPMAAGAETGTVCFDIDGAGSGVSGHGLSIRISTIDQEIAGRRVAMIKADVEGFEYDVLLGAREVIARDHPRIAVTVYHHENNVPQIRALLKRLYPAYKFETRGLAPNGHPVMMFAY